MLNEVFKQQEYAEITIKVGDYIVTMEGELDPPILSTDRFDKNLYSLGYKDGLFKSDISEIQFTVKPKSRLVAKQWRWTIPVAIPPRIEE
jgi:hypothetical protein